MSDPVSAVGSVLAVVACAAETSKILFKFFRCVGSVPRDIHQSSEALRSLQVTLLGLQRCGSQLQPEYRFSSQFNQRLDECLHQLNEWANKIKKADAKFIKKGSLARTWDSKATQSWERIKWIVHGEQEMRRFFENIRLYQSEFSIELLALLL